MKEKDRQRERERERERWYGRLVTRSPVSEFGTEFESGRPREGTVGMTAVTIQITNRGSRVLARPGIRLFLAPRIVAFELAAS